MKYIPCLIVCFYLLLCANSPQALVHFDFEQPYFSEPGFVVKDHCLVRVDGVYHLFYLRGNPAINIGHATSTDLIHWALQDPVLYVEPGTWDELALWAPQIIQTGSSDYIMYYTGVNNVFSQQTGLALSANLYQWGKVPWPIYHPDPSWAEWSDTTWSHGRDPFVFEHDGTLYMLITAKTLTNQGAIASAVSDNYVQWQDNGPIYVHDTWHVLESVQCIHRNSKFHLFFTEEDVFGTSYMMSDSLYSGWDISTRTIIDLGQAAEVDLFDDEYLFSRHITYYDEGELTYIIRFDPLSWVGDSPTIYKPWPLSKDWNLVSGVAFAFQPTFGENLIARGESVSVGFEGRCWIGSKERYQGPLMYGSPGSYMGDPATGLIRSNPFIITGNSMNLLVSGGNFPDECYVALVDSATGEFFFKETGKNSDVLSRRYWDLVGYKGRKVYIEIADLATDSFGHINVDDITESMNIITPIENNNRRKSKRKPGCMVSSAYHSADFTLYQNSPNPFNPSTTISYYLPAESHVTLDIFDVNGALVRRIVAGTKQEGLHRASWSGRNSHGSAVSAGIYFYRLTANGTIIDTKKMVLLR